MVKRGATAADATATAKRARAEEDPEVAAKCSAVAKALNSDASQLPKSAREMFRSVIPYALTVPESTRAPQQASVVAMIGQTLDNMEAALQSRIAAFEEPLQANEAQRQSYAEALQAQEETLAQRQQVVETKTEALAEVTVSVRAAKAGLQEALEAKATFEKDLLVAEKEREHVADLRDRCFQPLLAGTCGDEAEHKRCQAGVTRLGKACTVVDSLMTALPGVLETPPGSRGGFDATVLEQFAQAVSGHLATLQAKIDAGAPGRAERQAAVEDAEKTLEEAKEAQRQAAMAKKADMAEEASAEQAAKEATKTLKDFEKELNGYAKSLKQSKTKLEVFQAGVLAPFKELKELPLPQEIADKAMGEAAMGEEASAEAVAACGA